MIHGSHFLSNRSAWEAAAAVAHISDDFLSEAHNLRFPSEWILAVHKTSLVEPFWSREMNLPSISRALGDGRDARVKFLDRTNLRCMDGWILSVTAGREGWLGWISKPQC